MTVTPKLNWSFDEKAKAYKATLGGYPIVMTRDPRNGQLRATYTYNALDDQGRETERVMTLPLHHCKTVAEARVELPGRIMESLTKTAPDFAKEVSEAAAAEQLQEYAETDEKI